MRLEKIVRSARKERLSQFDIEHISLIQGRCKENALFLLQFLQEQGIECSLVKGFFQTKRMESIPQSFQEAKEIGAVHYWVQTKNGLHIDLCSEPEGEIVISEQVPSDYEVECIVEDVDSLR